MASYFSCCYLTRAFAPGFFVSLRSLLLKSGNRF